MTQNRQIAFCFYHFQSWTIWVYSTLSSVRWIIKYMCFDIIKQATSDGSYSTPSRRFVIYIKLFCKYYILQIVKCVLLWWPFLLFIVEFDFNLLAELFFTLFFSFSFSFDNDLALAAHPPPFWTVEILPQLTLKTTQFTSHVHARKNVNWERKLFFIKTPGHSFAGNWTRQQRNI